DAELAQAVSDAIAASGAQGPQEMGKVMALLKARLAGRVDLSKVSAIVKARLA
ncbi:MAG: GatB/YqeY domain-containing protein, partial [Burkholderiales bacterium]